MDSVNFWLILRLANFIGIVAASVALFSILIIRMRTENRAANVPETSPSSSPDFVDNQRKILEMIQQNKISIDDGGNLISEMNKKARSETMASNINKQYLRRRSDNKQLAGVCGAIADYFGINKTMARSGFLLLTVVTGCYAMTIFYIVAIFILPNDNREKAELISDKESCA